MIFQEFSPQKLVMMIPLCFSVRQYLFQFTTDNLSFSTRKDTNFVNMFMCYCPLLLLFLIICNDSALQFFALQLFATQMCCL